MDIQPASLAQVRAGRDGRRVTIVDDVGGVAADLQRIDPSLRLRWNELGEYFVVYQVMDNGDEKLVLTALELDPRIVERVEQIASPLYDYGAEVERLDAQAERDSEHRFHERVGPLGEIAAHALRKDLEERSKIILPRSV